MTSVSGSMSAALTQVGNSRPPLSFMSMVQRGARQLPEKLSSWRLIHQTTTATAMAVHGNAGEITDIHSRNRSKTLVKESLYEYLRELRLITQEHTYGHMRSTPDEALLLSLLVKMMGAKNTIEIGVFTGCSVLATALAIPDDGQVVAIDVSREYFSLGLPVIEKAGVAHKIDFREGLAGPILDKLLADEGNMGRFDFAFVDADKSSYGSYHDKLLALVRVGGVLAYDNTLWGGTVAMPDDTPLRDEDREIRESMMAFNIKIAAETRVDAVQLPVADGITLCRRRL